MVTGTFFSGIARTLHLYKFGKVPSSPRLSNGASSHWPRFLLWHGSSPAPSACQGGCPWAGGAGDVAGYRVECAPGANSPIPWCGGIFLMEWTGRLFAWLCPSTLMFGLLVARSRMRLLESRVSVLVAGPLDVGAAVGMCRLFWSVPGHLQSCRECSALGCDSLAAGCCSGTCLG